MTQTANPRVSDRRGIEDRRHHERLALHAPAEIATERQAALIHAQTMDVSLGGCSLSSAEALAPDQEVTVVITVAGRIILATARVIHVALGRAGIEFLRLTPGPRRTLRAWLGEPGPRQSAARRIR